MKSPIVWFGGKGMMSSKLLKYVPPHTYYLEAFGGGASLLFAKRPVPLEVYNDINSDLVNFYRVLRDKEKFKEFYHKVSLTPYSREEYYHCKETWESTEDEVERVYRWFIVARMSFSGMFGQGWKYTIKSFNRKIGISVSKFLSTIDMLPEIHNRIQTVQIDHADWKKVLERYNIWGNKGFYYLDPPYLSSTRRSGGYKHEMEEKDHEELINWLLNECIVKVMLSGYDNELYRQLENIGWSKICWDVMCHVTLRKEKKIDSDRRTECIWVNYLKKTKEIEQKTFD